MKLLLNFDITHLHIAFPIVELLPLRGSNGSLGLRTVDVTSCMPSAVHSDLTFRSIEMQTDHGQHLGELHACMQCATHTIS